MNSCRTYFNSITNVLISDSTRYSSLVTDSLCTAARTPVMPFDLIARPYSYLATISVLYCLVNNKSKFGKFVIAW
jgi:hypothetical protein